MPALQPQQPTEQPLYLLPQSKKRILLPKLSLFLFLGIIFYLGILINISLLELTASAETATRLASIIILITIIVLGIFLNLKKAKQKYYFYQNRITFQHQQISLRQITAINKKQNFLDKLFKTYSLALSQKFIIRNIPQKIQLQEYIQKLITYAQGQTTY